MTEQIGRSRTKVKVDAYVLGKRAWQEQLTEGNNPFPAGSAEWEKWRAGFRSERADSLLHEKL